MPVVRCCATWVSQLKKFPEEYQSGRNCPTNSITHQEVKLSRAELALAFLCFIVAKLFFEPQELPLCFLKIFSTGQFLGERNKAYSDTSKDFGNSQCFLKPFEASGVFLREDTYN